MNNQSTPLSPWTLGQPIIVLGATILTAYTAINPWIELEALAAILIFSPIFALLALERVMPKRRDWLLNWKDFAEDFFWVFGTYFIWIPLYDDFYNSPISDLFTSIRESLGFSFSLEANTTAGLVLVALIGILAVEFIGYWAHRLQHRFMFLWRIHATHHHITKMSVARAQRTHPLEFLGLNLGSAVALAFLGASPEVAVVVLVFRLTTAHICHSNLPFKSGIFGWVFNTPQWHQLHHSCNYAESNTNFGCTVIIWDRVFGTFCGKETIERVGNGTGRQLSLITQLTIPFRSNTVLRNL